MNPKSKISHGGGRGGRLARSADAPGAHDDIDCSPKHVYTCTQAPAHREVEGEGEGRRVRQGRREGGTVMNIMRRPIQDSGGHCCSLEPFEIQTDPSHPCHSRAHVTLSSYSRVLIMAVGQRLGLHSGMKGRLEGGM